MEKNCTLPSSSEKKKEPIKRRYICTLPALFFCCIIKMANYKKKEDVRPEKAHPPVHHTQMKIHLPCKIMIIDFNHSFKDYNEILNFYGVWDYECPNPSCNAKMHPMRRHATYERGLILWDSENHLPREGRMEILRLKCSSCGKTHAVLTMDMIPFFSYSIHAFLSLVAMCLGPDSSVLHTEKETGVSYQLLYRFLQIFHEYAHSLMLFLRLEALWDSPEQPLDSQLIPLLKAQPPPWPASRFFRRLRLPLFLHRRSTVPYPLVFGAAFA